MTKIMHVTAPAAFGGLESVVGELIRGSVARGHQVVLVVSLGRDTQVPAWALSLESDQVNLVPLHLSSRAYLAERRLVCEAARANQVDVIHSHGFRSDVLHLGVARALGVPIVSTAHGFASTNFVGRVYERLQVMAWKRYDAVVAVSEPLMAVLRRAGVPESRLVMIRNGLASGSSLKPRARAREILGIPANAPVVGWVGRMSEEKNPLLAVDAVARLGDSSVRLCMVGDGPLRATCVERAVSLGAAERVVMAGPQPDAGSLLLAFDALLLTSRTEGTPMVLLEAAIAEVPIVATSVGGVPALVGADGLMAPSGDTEALAASLHATLASPGESLLRARQLRTRLIESDQRDDWVGKYLALYESL